MTAIDLNPRNHPLNALQSKNLEKLAETITELQYICGLQFIITSGFRTAEEQMRINPHNPKSAHCTGEAVDILDLNHEIFNWCLDNLGVIAALGLYIEDKSATPRWFHCQIRVTKSGNLVFLP